MSTQREQKDSKLAAGTHEKRTSLDPLPRHDPIIITGGSSMHLLFDGPKEGNYRLVNARNPTRYSSNGKLKIAGVSVISRGRIHVCPGVPSHGKCTVTINGKRNGKPDNAIVVSGSDTDLVIEFNDKEYPKGSFINKRKKYGHKERHIKSLTIKDDVSCDVHTCTAIPANGKCDVEIRDDHRP